MDTDNFYEKELTVVQAAIVEWQLEIKEEELEYQALAGMGTIAYGLKQAQQLHCEHQYEQH